jgi:hypothetical protein
MSLLKGFGRFWYDFIVGDDWKIAAGVAAVLALAALAASSVADPSWLPPVAAVALAAVFTVSLVLDLKRP